MLPQRTTNQNNKLDSLYNQLEKLEEFYGDHLKGEHIKKEVECIKGWLESYRDGSELCGEWLDDHGQDMLEDIKAKLKLALEEEQNSDDEFPHAHPETESKNDELSKAFKIASKAERKFHEASAQ